MSKQMHDGRNQMRFLATCGIGAVAAILVVLGFATAHTMQVAASTETWAMGGLNTYSTAQGLYRTLKGKYANPYSLLRTELGNDDKPLNLIPASLADARGPNGRPKGGYLFWEPTSIGGRPIDWSRDYALCATPCQYGVDGYRTFVVTSDGRLYGQDLGRSEFISDVPYEPETTGWEDMVNGKHSSTPASRLVLGSMIAIMVILLVWFSVAVIFPLALAHKVVRWSLYTLSADGQDPKKVAIGRLGGQHLASTRLSRYMQLPFLACPNKVAAVELLGYCGRPAVPSLVRLLNNSQTNDRMQVSALQAIQRIGPEAEDAIPIVKTLLQESNEPVRCAAAKAYASIEPAPALNPSIDTEGAK